MGFLVASIVCSVLVSMLLKVARKRKIQIEQAVAVNYFVAIALTMVVFKPDLSHPQVFLPTWWLFVALGILLPSVFVIMGKAVDSVGIVKSDAVQRLSLFLPIIASLTIFGEKLTEGRLIGLVLAFCAIFCLLWKTDSSKKSGSIGTQATLLLGVWCGYGVIDILFKQVAKSGTAFSGNLLVAFCLAAICMTGYLFAKSTKWNKEGIIGGVILGVLNFLNIVTYVSAHRAMSENPTLVFTGMNIGVIVGGMLIGAAIFKEKINNINAAGISIAIVAILCLFYWEQIIGLLG